MPNPRKNQVSLETTTYYHCIGRCVRRAYLWGMDQLSGRDYSHRKTWVVERLAQLSHIFSIDICAYAIMSNHYHLVLHVDTERAKAWSDQEVARRWGNLFSLPVLLQKFLENPADEQAATENQFAQNILNLLRQRLCDLSWFMRCLNEPIARRANKEDECTGRFWEGRFKSQPILDETGLLACCAYVDLNPVRAGIATTPEDSDFTAIQQRLHELTTHAVPEKNDVPSPNSQHQPVQLRPRLYPFSDTPGIAQDKCLPYRSREYMELLDWTANNIHAKTERQNETPPILERLGFDNTSFTQAMQAHAMGHGSAIGKLEQLRKYAQVMHKRFVVGVCMPDICPAH